MKEILQRQNMPNTTSSLRGCSWKVRRCLFGPLCNIAGSQIILKSLHYKLFNTRIYVCTHRGQRGHLASLSWSLWSFLCRTLLYVFLFKALPAGLVLTLGSSQGSLRQDLQETPVVIFFPPQPCSREQGTDRIFKEINKIFIYLFENQS